MTVAEVVRYLAADGALLLEELREERGSRAHATRRAALMRPGPESDTGEKSEGLGRGRSRKSAQFIEIIGGCA